METKLFEQLQEVFNSEYTIHKKEINKDCKHNNTIQDKGAVICTDCGFQKKDHIKLTKEWCYYGSNDTRHSSDPNRCHRRKNNIKTIQKDVINMGFSEQIVNIANRLYEKVTKGQIYRGKSRKSIILACIFHAYGTTGNPQLLKTLTKVFNLDRKTSLKGMHKVSLKLPELASNTYIKLENIIKYLLETLNANPIYLTDILNIYDKIKNKSSKLKSARPQSLASSLIYYYILIKNKDIHIDHYSKKVQLSKLTITKNVKEIAKILKTEHLIK